MKNSRGELWALLGLIILAFGLRLYRLGSQSLWLDEGLSVTFAQLPLERLWPTLVAEDIHPPLYIFSLHFWLKLAGASEFAARYLSLMAGVALVPALWRLARALFEGRAVALVAAGLLALSPFQVYFSQEARNYILVTLFSALASLMLWQALQREETGSPKPNPRGLWAGYAIFGSLTLYTHYYGGFVLLAHLLYLPLTRPGRRALRGGWLAAVAAMGLLYLPWAPGLWGQLTNLWLNPDYWPGSIDLWTIAQRTFASFSLGRALDLPQALLPALALFAALFLLGLARLLRQGLVRGRAEVFALLYLLVPLLVVYGLSAQHPKFTERYLIVITPPFYLILAQGLGAFLALARRWPAGAGAWRAGFALGLLVAAGTSARALYDVYYSDLYAKDDHRGAIQYIQAHERPGDAILLVRNTYQTFQYYYRGGQPWYGLDPGPRLEETAAQLRQIMAGQSRAWLLLWQEEWADPTGIVAGLLGDNSQEVPLAQSFHGVKLRLFEGVQPHFEPRPSHPLQAFFEGGVELLGYRLRASEATAGEGVRLLLYWRARGPIGEDLGLLVRVRDAYGREWGRREQPPTGYYFPTSQWPVGLLLRGEVEVPIAPGAPPGEYYLEINLYHTPSLRELEVRGPVGEVVGTRLALGPLMVQRPAQPPALADLAVAQPLAATFRAADGKPMLRLLGRGELPTRVVVSQAVELSLYWEVLSQALQGDYQGELALVDAQGASWPAAAPFLGRAAPSPPVAGYPAAQWRPGDRLEGRYTLRPPPGMPPGEYELRLALEGLYVPLARWKVEDRPRRFHPPQVSHRQTANFAGQVALIGYDLAGPGGRAPQGGVLALRRGEAFRIVLHWRAEAPIARSYKVFVHLVGPRGDPLGGQSDGVPGRWAMPTTGWAVGEYIADEHEVKLRPEAPAGKYGVAVGLYDQETGQRLAVLGDGGERKGDMLVLEGLEVWAQ